MNNRLPSIKFIRSFIYSLLFLSLLISLSACEKAASGLDGSPEVIRLYKANCISCHGSDLQGKMGPSSDLQHVGKQLNLDLITKQIHDGGDVMPAFADKLTSEQIKQLAQWLSAKK